MITIDQSLIFIRGLPGAGKSTIAKLLAKEIGAKVVNPSLTNLEDADFNRFCSIRKIGHLEWKNRKYRYNFHQCLNYLKDGKSVIWEQPWLVVEGLVLTIDNIEFLLGVGRPNFVVINVLINPKLARQRVFDRYRKTSLGISEKIFDEEFEGKQLLSVRDRRIILNLDINGEDSEEVNISKIKSTVSEY